MKLYVFEGSAEELSEVAKNLGVQQIPQDESPAAGIEKTGSATPDDDDVPVSVKFARRVLKRRPISEPMRAVLQALYDFGEEWLTMTELCEASDYTRSQFAGLMGAFGRRISHTDGHDEETYFFETEWDDEEGHLSYRIPATVREALEKEGVVAQS